MSPQIRALAWKEWRERRASLYFGIAWILLGLVYTIVYEVTTGIRGPVGRFYSICLIFGLFAPVFLAMRMALGERTERTLGFSTSLPAPLRQQAAVRMLAGLITLIGPIVLGTTFLSLVLATGALEQSALRPPHDPNYVDFETRTSLSRMAAVGATWKSTAIAAASASELMMILSVIGVRRRSEARVGFIGAFVAFAWIVPTEMLDAFKESSYRTAANWLACLFPQSLAISWGYDTPRGQYTDLEVAGLVWGPLFLNLLVLVGLCVWFTHRFAAAVPWMSDRKARINWRLPSLSSRLPLRMPGRAAALVWLDLRQSVPMAITGLALAFCIVVVDICMERRSAWLWSQYGDPSVPTIAAGQLAGATWIVATLWSAIVAVGIFGAELQPGLADFWRSRPVDPSMWFWTKFWVGLAATLTVLDGITIAVGWNSPYGSGAARMTWSYVACMPLLHALFYAVTVFAICCLRRPISGAACAVLICFLLFTFLNVLPARDGVDPISVYNSLFQAETRIPGSSFDLSAHGYPTVYGTIAVVVLVAAFGASRFVRRFPAVRA